MSPTNRIAVTIAATTVIKINVDQSALNVRVDLPRPRQKSQKLTNKESRIPVLAKSERLRSVVHALSSSRFNVQVQQGADEFQKAGNQMLGINK